MPINLSFDLTRPKTPQEMQAESQAVLAGQLQAQRDDKTKNFDEDQAMLDKMAQRAHDRRKAIFDQDQDVYNKVVASDQMFDAAASVLSHKQLMQVLKDTAEIKNGVQQAPALAAYYGSLQEYNQDWQIAESQLRAGSMMGLRTLQNVLTGVGGDAEQSANLEALRKFRRENSQPKATPAPVQGGSQGAGLAEAYASVGIKQAPSTAVDNDKNDKLRKDVMWGGQPGYTGGSTSRVGYDEGACYASQCLARVVRSTFGKDIVSHIDDPEHPGQDLAVPLEVIFQGMNGSSTLKLPNGRVLTDAKGISDKAFRALPGITQGVIKGAVKRAYLGASVGQPGFDEKAIAAVLAKGKPEDKEMDQQTMAMWKAATQGVAIDPDIQAVFLNAAENVYNYTGGIVQVHDIAKVRTAATSALAEAAGIKENELWDKAVLIKDMMIKDRIGVIQSQVRAGSDPALAIKDLAGDTPMGKMVRPELEKAKPYILQGIVSDPQIPEGEKTARINAFNQAWDSALSGVPNSDTGSLQSQRAFRESATGQDILADPEKSLVPGKSEPTLKVPYPFTMPEDIQPGSITQRYYEITAKNALGSSYEAALDPNVIKTYTDAVAAGGDPEEKLPPSLKPDTSGQDKLIEMAANQSAPKQVVPYEQSQRFRVLEATTPTDIGEGSNALNQTRRDAALKEYNDQRSQYDKASGGVSLTGSAARRPAMDPSAQPLQRINPQTNPGAAPSGQGPAPAPSPMAPPPAPAAGQAAPPASNSLTPTNPWTQAPAPQQYGFGNTLIGQA